MRFSIRDLLIVATFAPPLLAGAYFAWLSLSSTLGGRMLLSSLPWAFAFMLFAAHFVPYLRAHR